MSALLSNFLCLGPNVSRLPYAASSLCVRDSKYFVGMENGNIYECTPDFKISLVFASHREPILHLALLGHHVLAVSPHYLEIWDPSTLVSAVSRKPNPHPEDEEIIEISDLLICSDEDLAYSALSLNKIGLPKPTVSADSNDYVLVLSDQEHCISIYDLKRLTSPAIQLCEPCWAYGLRPHGVYAAFPGEQLVYWNDTFLYLESRCSPVLKHRVYQIVFSDHFLYLRFSDHVEVYNLDNYEAVEVFSLSVQARLVEAHDKLISWIEGTSLKYKTLTGHVCVLSTSEQPINHVFFHKTTNTYHIAYQSNLPVCAPSPWSTS